MTILTKETMMLRFICNTGGKNELYDQFFKTNVWDFTSESEYVKEHEGTERKSEKYENRNGGGYCQKTGNVPYL